MNSKCRQSVTTDDRRKFTKVLGAHNDKVPQYHQVYKNASQRGHCATLCNDIKTNPWLPKHHRQFS